MKTRGSDTRTLGESHRFLAGGIRLPAIGGRAAAALLLAAGLCAAGECALSKGGPLAAGDCYAARGEWRRAEQYYRTARHRNPQSPDAVVRHSQSLVRLDQPFDAVIELEELLAHQPDSIAALKLYAELLDTVVKHPVDATKALERLTGLSPNDADAWEALGIHYLSMRRVDEAVRCYRQAAKLKPAAPALIAGLAHCLGQAGRNAEADALFTRAARLNAGRVTRDPKVLLVHGEYLLSRDRVPEAVRVFTDALMLDPHSEMGYFWRATALEKLGDFKRAEVDALAALRQASDQKPIHLLLIRVYRGLNRPEKVEEHANAVARLADQESAEHGRARAVTAALRQAEPLLRQGRFAEALPHYQEILRQLPTFYEAHFALGMCYSQTGRAREAEAAFRTYLSLQPLSADGHTALGALLLEQGRMIEARPELEEAVRLDPAEMEPRKALAHIHSTMGEFDAAVKWLQAIADSPQADAQALLMLAEALAKTGDTAGAARQVDRVLKEEPGNVGALQLKQALGR